MEKLTHYSSEVFLPFDLEFTYAAAIHLAMANVLFPRVPDSQTSSQDAHAILDEMVHKGNRLAEVRKTELAHLETLFQELGARIERRGLQTLTLSTSPDQANTGITNDPGEEPQGRAFPTDHEEIDSLHSPLPSALAQAPNHPELLDNIGISSYEFLSIVDQIGNQDYYGILDPVQAWKEGI